MVRETERNGTGGRDADVVMANVELAVQDEGTSPMNTGLYEVVHGRKPSAHRRILCRVPAPATATQFRTGCVGGPGYRSDSWPCPRRADRVGASRCQFAGDRLRQPPSGGGTSGPCSISTSTSAGGSASPAPASSTSPTAGISSSPSPVVTPTP